MSKFQQIIRASIVGCLLMVTSPSYALDGSNNVFVTVPSGANTGWKTFEIISGGDDLSTVNVGNDFSDTWSGKYTRWDGLGAYRYDADTLRIFINHENGPDSSFSRLDLNVPALHAWLVAGAANNTNSNQVTPASPVVDTISRGWVGLGSGTDPINNPCTGNVWLADTFGPGRGFAEGLYMTGEEVFAPRDGHIWVMNLATRLLYEATDLGIGSWENAGVIDTGRTDTIAVMLSEDFGRGDAGTAPISLYVGEKDPDSTSFLARNGLVGGKIYYWHADSAGTNGTMSGLFSAGNGTVVPGSWKSARGGAVLISKSEDLHANMDRDSEGFGVQVALASQDEAVFLIDCSDLEFVAGDLSSTARDTSVQVLYEASTQATNTNVFSAMDNLVWSADGKIYVNEDDEEGDIWVIEVASLLASYAGGDTTPDTSQVYEILDAEYVSESSGIIDISEALAYVPGSIFLTTGFSSTLSDNQLALLVSPSAQFQSHVFTSWALSFPALDTEAKRAPTADPDGDGYDNATEFALGLLPDTAESVAPYTVEPLASSAQVSFNAARSLDLVDYYVDYTSNLSAGFTNTLMIRAVDVAENGDVQLSLPESDQFFVRIRAVLP